MPSLETFAPPAGEWFKLYMHPSNRDKDGEAMIRMYQLYDSYHRCARLGATYAQGFTTHRVLGGIQRHSATGPREDEVLGHPVADPHRPPEEQQARRLSYREMARRFVVNVVEDRGGYSAALRRHSDLAGASQQDIKSLVGIFEAWRADTLGEVYMDNLSRYNTRFCDFLVIDEGSLRSLATLPEETPHLGPVSRAERMARNALYENSYVWLVDSRAAKRFQSVEGPVDCDGYMKLRVDDIYDAWFERAARFEDLDWSFKREGKAGEKWYCPQ